jgi:tetratricopeptide (TPR) repeat protein
MKRALAILLLALALFAATARADGLTDIDAAQTAARAQDFVEAIRLFTSALATGKLTPLSQSIAYDGRGSAYYQEGRWDQAIADYTAAIQLESDCGRCFNNRGLAYDRKSDLDKAIADFNQAISLEPGEFDGYFNRGNAFYGKTDYEHAIADYTAAISIKPDCGVCYHNRGVAYQDLGKLDKANEDLNTADQMKN